MSRTAFTRSMESMPAFRSLMYAYVQAFLEQVMVSGSVQWCAQPQGAGWRVGCS